MLQQLRGRRSLLRVLRQAQRNKGLKFFGPAGVDTRRFLLHDVEDHTTLGFADVGRVAVRHLHRENAKRPDVHLCSVLALAANQLWGHPADGADLALAAGFLLSQLHCVAKICQLYLALGIEQQVVRLNVSVDNVPIVQELQTFQRLLQYELDYVFRVGLVECLNVLGQRVVHQLEEHPESLLEIVRLNHFEDALVCPTLTHNAYLIYD